MPGSNAKYAGDRTYEVSAAVVGGTLVQLDGTTGKVKPVAAAGGIALGVAHTDAEPASDSDTSTDSFGDSVVNLSLRPAYTAVATSGIWLLLVSGTTLNIGDFVQADAAGGVKKVVPDGTTNVVGYVVNPGGAAAGAMAEIKLMPDNGLLKLVAAAVSA